jgi:hypothetical protein
MITPVRFVVSAAFAGGFAMLAPSAASAMPIANVGLGAAPLTEDVHAVRMCNRWGRCWWTYAGHYHPRYYGYYRGGYRYGWHRPYYGYRYGWRHPYYRHYGYGWHRGYGARAWHGHWR